MERFQLDIKERELSGTGACRRMRKQKLVPAVVYGGEAPPRKISLEAGQMSKAMEDERFFSQPIDLQDSKPKGNEVVILRTLQQDPYRPVILHADFLRIKADQPINVAVPLHYLNEENCYGVKREGGIIAHLKTELEVRCLPGNVPDFIEVDMAEVSVGGVVHVSALRLPEGVESMDLVHGEDTVVTNVVAPRGGMDEEEAEEEAAEAPAEGEEEAQPAAGTDEKE